jgi:hypothetical protein
MPRAPITRERPYTPRSGAFASRTFYSEREYRNSLARLKGYRSWGQQQRNRPAAVTEQEVRSLTTAEAGARARALRALARMRREDISLGEAAAREGTTPNTVVRHARPALIGVK